MMENINFNILIEQVCDEESFLIFLNSLMNDRIDEVRKEKINPSSLYGPGANGWENNTIEGFLDSAIGWARDSKRGSENIDSGADAWKRCAQIIYMGKLYE